MIPYYHLVFEEHAYAVSKETGKDNQVVIICDRSGVLAATLRTLQRKYDRFSNSRECYVRLNDHFHKYKWRHRNFSNHNYNSDEETLADIILVRFKYYCVNSEDRGYNFPISEPNARFTG
jgi:hypothetical protein